MWFAWFTLSGAECAKRGQADLFAGKQILEGWLNTGHQRVAAAG
jgi:hypothetical protein